MRKLIAIAIFAVSAAAGWGYAQEMPPEIKEFLDNYTKDSTAAWGPLQFKKDGAIPESIRVSDLRLRVIQEYVFRNDIDLYAYPNTVALSEVIMPIDRWRVAVMVHNKAFYEFILVYRKGTPKVAESTVGRVDMSGHLIWGPLLKAYPESTSINPVLVVLYRLCSSCSPVKRSFLYFKQLGPRKIYFCNKNNFSPDLDSLFPASIETLDDSKKLIKYKKELDIKRKEDSARLEKAKADGKEENVEQKKFFSHPALYSNPGINTKPTIKQGEIEIDHKKLFSTVP